MKPKATLLEITRAEIVMIVEASLPDCNDLRVLRARYNIGKSDIGFFVGVVGMRAN